jgi:hypothetical protein
VNVNACDPIFATSEKRTESDRTSQNLFGRNIFSSLSDFAPEFGAIRTKAEADFVFALIAVKR